MKNLGSEKHVSIHMYRSEEILYVISHWRQPQGSVGPTWIFSLSVHWNEDSHNKNECCKYLMKNLGSEKHVSIHMYRSEEIPDVIGHRRQPQGSVGPTRIFSLLVHWSEVNYNKNECCNCFMKNLGSKKHVSIYIYRSEEIPDVIGHRRQPQGTVSTRRTFSLLLH